jgi:hypothetical protein
MSPPPWTLDHYGQPWRRTTLAFRAYAISCACSSSWRSSPG